MGPIRLRGRLSGSHPGLPLRSTGLTLPTVSQGVGVGCPERADIELTVILCSNFLGRKGKCGGKRHGKWAG